MKKISKTELAQKIYNETRGRIFSVLWTDQNGNLRKVVGNFASKRTENTKHRNDDKIIGYTTMFDFNKRKVVRVDDRTIHEVAMNKERYMVK